jgi:putative ABC transport system substrate-binding protein
MLERLIARPVARSRRLALLVVSGCLIVPCLASAQGTERVHRVAFVYASFYKEGVPESDLIVTGYKVQLASRGFREGKNLQFRVFYRRLGLEASDGGLKGLLAEVIAWKPDLIQTSTVEVARIARAATSTIPIVFANALDPVSAGLVESLARPGGNVTGVGTHYGELLVKRVEFVRELLPKARRLLLLVDRGGGGMPQSFKENLGRALQHLGFLAEELDVADVDGLCKAASRIARAQPEAVLTVGNFLVPHGQYGSCLAELQFATGVPFIDDSLGTVDEGVLAALGDNGTGSFRRAADVAARVLGGAKPGDVPVDMEARFGLHLNAGSARKLGLKLPRAVTLRADRVIE